MSHLETVRLRTGAEEPQVTVNCILLVLRRLIQEEPIVFYELVMVARDPKHRPFGKTGERLEALALLNGGRMHDSVRNVILAATEGELTEMRLVSPYAPPAPFASIAEVQP